MNKPKTYDNSFQQIVYIEEMPKEIKEFSDQSDKLQYEIDAYKTMFEELKKENKILREALEFYAVSETYVLLKIEDKLSQVVDKGTIAREALEKVNK